MTKWTCVSRACLGVIAIGAGFSGVRAQEAPRPRLNVTEQVPTGKAKRPTSAQPGMLNGVKPAAGTTQGPAAKEPVQSALIEQPVNAKGAAGQPGLQSKLPPNMQMAPELLALLKQWEEHSSEVKRLDGKLKVMIYDSVFQTETRGEGNFWYESPDKGRLDLIPSDLSKLQKNASGEYVSPKKGANGQTYIVKPQAYETWNCDGKQILQLFSKEKSYSRMTIPEQYQGEAIRNSPLPFLFGMKKADAQKRYLLNLGDMHQKTLRGMAVPVIHVVAYPLLSQDAQEWQRAEVLLYSDTFLPFSIKTIDPAGSKETVYVFGDLNPNGKWLLKNPFSVSTFGYTLTRDLDAEIAPQAAAPAKAKGAFNKQQVQPAAGQK
jgi:hypothetical protein